MEQVKAEQMIYSTVIYCRLSKDDEQAGESVSIETQKMMLTDFCRDSGKINLVVTKDLSRLDRDYIQTSYYRNWIMHFSIFLFMIVRSRVFSYLRMELNSNLTVC